MARRKDPARIADKQISRLSAAVPEIEDGIRAVDESPTAKAAARLDVAKSNFIKAVDSGKMARRLQAVSLEDWRRATLAKVGRIGEGIAAARPKIEKFHAQRNAWQDQIDRELGKIEKRTLADSIRRMTTQVTEMSKHSFDPTA